MEGGVVERGGDDEHRPSSEQPSSDVSADDLPLRSGERDGEGGGRDRRRGCVEEEGGGHGEDVEAAMEGNSAGGSDGGLAESNITDSSRTGEDTEARVLSAAEPG